MEAAGLSEFVHKRRFEAGPRLGITTARAFFVPPKNDEEEKWHQPERHPATDEEKKKITAMAVITAVEAVMANHVYNFDNAWGKQNDGGGISNLLTGEVAKVVMAW